MALEVTQIYGEEMISVIIPLYNKEKIIERTLRSVLSQDYDDFEVIIVDDGSTDDSYYVVKETIKLLKPFQPIQLLHQQNGGPSKARNTGLKNSNGEWIVFLDADDEFLPGALKMFSEVAERHTDADFIASPFYNLNGTKRTLQFPYKEGYVKNPFVESFYERLLPRMGAFICKREFLLQNRLDEKIRRFEDLEMLYRVYHTARIYTCSEPSMIVNTEYASASHGRNDITEDFLGYLNFSEKSFWERMCLYKLFLGERPRYPEQAKKLYPLLYKRLDYYLLYQFLTRTKKIWA